MEQMSYFYHYIIPGFVPAVLIRCDEIHYSTQMEVQVQYHRSEVTKTHTQQQQTFNISNQKKRDVSQRGQK